MIVKPVGIENVVNWQDNGIFADTQKPVTDDNYTLAGDVNQDNLFVGYMKEHGLKGKLSLPVLSSLGAITGRQTIGDCEVYKHVNGTTIIKGAVINQNLPDSRISLGFSADENGLQYYNNPNDPMPIKTINMAGLQKWEETEDYIIYVDKDAVMTTVQQYVTGTYDLFLERKNQVDGSMELLRDNNIEWTAEDDSKLLQDINLAQLEKIMSFPSTLEEEFEPQTLEARAVPTTYECCFRTDKKTGEIYIGGGYENYSQIINLRLQDGMTKKIDDNGYMTLTYDSEADSKQAFYENFHADFLKTGEAITQSLVLLKKSNDDFYVLIRTYSPIGVSQTKADVEDVEFVRTHESISDYKGGWIHGLQIKTTGLQHDNYSVELKYITTKTSTPKPFVKSVMPSGKLSFVTK